MDGYALTEYVRAHFPHVIVVVLTASDIEDVQTECQRHGAHYVFQKPFDLDVIGKLLQSIKDA
jgi:CheY-like chemotaxis protein